MHAAKGASADLLRAAMVRGLPSQALLKMYSLSVLLARVSTAANAEGRLAIELPWSNSGVAEASRNACKETAQRQARL